MDKYAKYEYNTLAKETTIISYKKEYANDESLFFIKTSGVSF